jgi:hypothetical protein
MAKKSRPVKPAKNKTEGQEPPPATVSPTFKKALAVVAAMDAKNGKKSGD